MVQLLKRDPIQFSDIIRLSGLTDLQLSKTSNDNYNQILDSRIDSLGNYDGLTEEEIKDIQEFRSNPKNTKRFTSVDELITDLND